MSAAQPSPKRERKAEPKATDSKTKIVDIPVYLIEDPPIAMHPDATEQQVEELANSIKKVGQLQNIIVRPVKDHYQVIVGHMRVLAAKRFNIPTMRAEVKAIDEAEALGMTFEENLARKDHNPYIEIVGVNYALHELKMKIEEMMKRYGWSRKWIEDRLALGSLPKEVQENIASRKLTLGAALHLLRLPTPLLQVKFGYDFTDPNYTVVRCGQVVNAYLTLQAELNRPPTEAEIKQVYDEPLVICAWCKHPVKISGLQVVQVCSDCLDYHKYLEYKDKRENPPKPPPTISLGQTEAPSSTYPSETTGTPKEA